MIQFFYFLQDVVKQLLVVLPLLTALAALLYWRLQKRVESEIANRLERTKHELQLELQKQSIVFQHQKDSFHRIVRAMNEALECIEQNANDGDWRSVRADQLETLRKVFSEESLFSDDATDHALHLFAVVMYDAVIDEPQGHCPDSDDVYHAYKWMKLISVRVLEHFRGRMGMLQSVLNPLIDVELLGACRLISIMHFHALGFPTTTLLKCSPPQSPEETSDIARQHLDLLDSELRRLKDAMMQKKERAAFYYEYSVRIDRYRQQIASLLPAQKPSRSLSTSA